MSNSPQRPAEGALSEAARLEAPWTNAEVEQLNDWQQAGYVHEFTCPNRGEHDDTRGALVATPDGWVCPQCEYTQTWAWKFMLNVPPNPLEALGWAT